MTRKLSAALWLAVMAPALAISSPAPARDPCVQAIQTHQLAWDAFWRWCNNHPVQCNNGTGRYDELRDLLIAAGRRANKACSN